MLRYDFMFIVLPFVGSEYCILIFSTVLFCNTSVNRVLDGMFGGQFTLNVQTTAKQLQGHLPIQHHTWQQLPSHPTIQFYEGMYHQDTRECNALWGKPERAIEVCYRFCSTIEDGALSLSQRRMWLIAGQDLVIGVRIEVYANCELYNNS